MLTCRFYSVFETLSSSASEGCFLQENYSSDWTTSHRSRSITDQLNWCSAWALPVWNILPLGGNKSLTSLDTNSLHGLFITVDMLLNKFLDILLHVIQSWKMLRCAFLTVTSSFLAECENSTNTFIQAFRKSTRTFSRWSMCWTFHHNLLLWTRWRAADKRIASLPVVASFLSCCSSAFIHFVDCLNTVNCLPRLYLIFLCFASFSPDIQFC